MSNHTPPPPIHIFVSYSHRDASYIQDDSLLGFLNGLQKDGAVFWDDRQILGGQPWHEVIKAQIQQAQMALVFVSQSFLDSDYCQNQEIRGFLARQAHIFPVILSPCEWKRHDWLASRQFLPAGDQTIEEHFQDPGKRKRLFLTIREQLREVMDQIRKEWSHPGHQPGATPPDQPAIPPTNPSARTPGKAAAFSGPTKLAFCKHLGDDWSDLADMLEIDPATQRRFAKGEEGRAIWHWLHDRQQLHRLPAACHAIHRPELADLFTSSS